MKTQFGFSLNLDTDPKIFLEKVSPALEREASIHSFFLSLTTRYVQNHKPMALLAHLANSNGELIAAGIQTETDRVLIISNCTEADAITFSDLLSEDGVRLPGVNGPSPAVDSFAKKWASHKGPSF
jgi:hypothetical protein